MTSTAGRRWFAPALVGAAGVALLWVMRLSGGDFWRSQRPFMPVTLVCASIMIGALMLATAAPRGAGKFLLRGLAVVAVLATFLGEGLAERDRFESLRTTLSGEVEAIARGGACKTACRLDSRTPLRVAFLLSGEGAHWSGVCYDATDTIYDVEYGAACGRQTHTKRLFLPKRARCLADRCAMLPAGEITGMAAQPARDRSHPIGPQVASLSGGIEQLLSAISGAIGLMP